MMINCIHASNEKIRDQFENTYGAWRVWLEDHRYSSDLTNNPEFNAIETLGPSILPLLVEKIENSPSDFHLWVAICRITKKHFDGTLGDSHKAARMYVHWWKNDRNKMPKQFAEKYATRTKALKEGKNEEADRLLKEITWFGLDALPLIIEKIKSGDESLIPIVSKLTDGAVDARSSKSDCLDWLENNKDKWLLPPVEDSD